MQRSRRDTDSDFPIPVEETGSYRSDKHKIPLMILGWLAAITIPAIAAVVWHDHESSTRLQAIVEQHEKQLNRIENYLEVISRAINSK